MLTLLHRHVNNPLLEENIVRFKINQVTCIHVACEIN